MGSPQEPTEAQYAQLVEAGQLASLGDFQRAIRDPGM